MGRAVPSRDPARCSRSRGLVAAFVAVVLPRRRRTRSSPRARWPSTARRCSCRARSCCSAIPGVLLLAERALDTGGAVRPGRLGDARLRSTSGPLTADRRHADRGLPAADVRRRRHAALPGRQRPADDVRRPRGALAAAVPAVRAGPPPPAAQPGGGAQVLPARRVLVGVLPLRRRAALRLRRHVGCRGIADAVSTDARRRRAAATSASRCSPSACCSRSAPRRSTRGRPTSTRARPTPVTALHGRLHQGRRVRRAAAGVLRRRSAGCAGTGGR